jgi:hypothetical protein
MNNLNTLPQPSNLSITDLNSLRLPTNYGATLGVQKLLTTVPVGKPNKSTFFRVKQSEELAFNTFILENKVTRETYIVVPVVAQVISELVRPVMLNVAIDRQNNVSLIPVQLPQEDGTRNPWHESLAQAVERAKTNWIRINPNMQLGVYDVYEATAELPEPIWPSRTIDELVDVAFLGKIIRTVDHPIVQTHLGKI